MLLVFIGNMVIINGQPNPLVLGKLRLKFFIFILIFFLHPKLPTRSLNDSTKTVSFDFGTGLNQTESQPTLHSSNLTGQDPVLAPTH
mmetsp:Transcript_6242/g.7179  ORF Transcript_6242/g.7179 Transcript_6242/m.7179 type:complete len:87 (-) Transcript_6242:326-586(-)